MKTEGWGNAAAVEIQELTASKLLPQLPQDERLWSGWYADPPPETHAGSGGWDFNQIPPHQDPLSDTNEQQ